MAQHAKLVLFAGFGSVWSMVTHIITPFLEVACGLLHDR
jgi:hypothetical protein